jgi:hypothetical protein
MSDLLPVLLSRGLVPSDALAAFLVGSVARGWANPGSDYDVNVVTAVPPTSGPTGQVLLPLDPPTVPVADAALPDRRCEVKYFLDTQVDQLLAKVSWAAYEGAGTAGGQLGTVEELFLERLATCVPLTGSEWVQQRRSSLAASAFGAYTVTRSLAQADGSVEDALGQLAAGDVESAVLSARKAYGNAVDALCESRGEYGYHLPKWRARRVRAVASAALPFDTYWAVETMRAYDPADPAAWVESVLYACADLALATDIPPSPR